MKKLRLISTIVGTSLLISSTPIIATSCSCSCSANNLEIRKTGAQVIDLRDYANWTIKLFNSDKQVKMARLEASTKDPSIAKVVVWSPQRDYLSVIGKDIGKTTLTIKVTDENGWTITKDFDIQVKLDVPTEPVGINIEDADDYWKNDSGDTLIINRGLIEDSLTINVDFTDGSLHGISKSDIVVSSNMSEQTMFVQIKESDGLTIIPNSDGSGFKLRLADTLMKRINEWYATTPGYTLEWKISGTNLFAEAIIETTYKFLISDNPANKIVAEYATTVSFSKYDPTSKYNSSTIITNLTFYGAKGAHLTTMPTISYSISPADSGLDDSGGTNVLNFGAISSGAFPVTAPNVTLGEAVWYTITFSWVQSPGKAPITATTTFRIKISY